MSNIDVSDRTSDKSNLKSRVKLRLTATTPAVIFASYYYFDHHYELTLYHSILTYSVILLYVVILGVSIFLRFNSRNKREEIQKIRRWRDRFMRVTNRIVWSILIGFLSIIAYNELQQIPLLQKNLYNLSLEKDNVLDNYFSVISTLYAVLIALTLIKAYEDFDVLKQIIIDEINRIRSVVSLLRYFKQDDWRDINDKIDQTKKMEICHNNKHISIDMRKLLIKYLEAVSIHATGSNKNEEILKECIDQVENLKPVDSNDQIALEKIMDSFIGLGATRAKRINWIESKSPRVMLWALAILSVITVLPFFIKTHNPGIVNFYIIFVLSSSFGFLFATLLDINTPTSGFWRLNSRGYEDLLEEIRTEIEKEESKGGTGTS